MFFCKRKQRRLDVGKSLSFTIKFTDRGIIFHFSAILEEYITATCTLYMKTNVSFQVDFATLTQSQFWQRNRSGSVFVSSFQGKTNTEIEYYCVSTVPWHREGPIFCYYIKPFCHHNNVCNVDTYLSIRDWVLRPTVTTFHSHFVQQNGFI